MELRPNPSGRIYVAFLLARLFQAKIRSHVAWARDLGRVALREDTEQRQPSASGGGDNVSLPPVPKKTPLGRALMDRTITFLYLPYATMG